LHFSKSVRLEAAVDHKGRPIDRPDESESSSMPAVCPNWIPERCPGAQTPTSDMPPCRGPRLAGTASVDSQLVSRLLFPPPFVSCNRIQRFCCGLIIRLELNYSYMRQFKYQKNYLAENCALLYFFF